MATLVKEVQRPTAFPDSRPYVSRRRARLFVVTNAPATPWSDRATISTAAFGAAPASADAAANPTTPAANVSRRPSRSPTAPAGR